jgi:hypothetical protein
MSKICSICGEPFEGHGNNSLPLAEGRCCDNCNVLVTEHRLSSKYTIYVEGRSVGKTYALVTKCELINLILKLRPKIPAGYLWTLKKASLLKFYKKLKENN